MPQQRANAPASPVKLSFKEKLTGRGLSSDAIQKKLKTLSTELADIATKDAENVDTASFATVRKELISTSIFLHKDKGVKAYAACCIADLLSIYAPDAPYTASELRDIFQFFFRQLVNGLKGSDAPYYDQYVHLLRSLSRAKSVVLVCDLPHADELLVEVFKDFFTLSKLNLPATVEAFMADILTALIDEAQSVLNEVLEILLAQFNAKKITQTNPTFRLAVEVCNAAAEKLQRYVCQHFTDIILQHSEDMGEERDFDEIRAGHTLIQRMHKYCPDILLLVIPQLEEEMRVDDSEIRLLATETLGEMYGDKNGSSLMKKYPSTWNTWIQRKNDKDPKIRVTFVDASRELVGNPELKGDITEALKMKILDPDDKVRAAVCKLYGALDYETAAHHVEKEQLMLVADRCKDKKHTVRLEAFDSMGKIYSHAVPEIDDRDPHATVHFGWIPQELLHAVALSVEVRAVAQEIIARYILPLPLKGDDEIAWTERLLKLLSRVDDKALDILFNLMGLKAQRPTIYAYFIDTCIENNGGTIDNNEEEVKKRLEGATKVVASFYPDPSKAADDLKAFAKHNDRRMYKLLKTCMDLQTDFKTLVKSTNEFNKRMEDHLPAAASTMATFLRRSSLWVVNTSSISTLLERISPSFTPASQYQPQSQSQAQATIENENTRVADISYRLLMFIAKHCPMIFESHVGLLTKMASDDKDERSTEIALRALAAVTRVDEKAVPKDSAFTDQMLRNALTPNPVRAKFATRWIALCSEKETQCPRLISRIAKGLQDAGGHTLLGHLAALNELSRFAPDTFEEHSDVIVKFLLHDVLVAPPAQKNDEDMEVDKSGEEDEDVWCDEDQLEPEIGSKLFVLRLLTNRCVVNSDTEGAMMVAQPVAKMLFNILENDGSFEVSPDKRQAPTARPQLRLRAAISLLKLATVEKYNRLIQPQFTLIATAVQDRCYEARRKFLDKVTELLGANKIKPVFNVIPFLTVHDPERDVRDVARVYVMTQMRKLPSHARTHRFELMLIRLLHLLAHHPDFATTEDSLPEQAKYIDFFIELVANAENVSLLYHLAVQCKTVYDNDGTTYSQNIYVLSELADYIIRTRAKHHSWVLASYPGKVTLPADIFKPLPSGEAASKIRKTVYLTDEMLVWVGEIGKPVRLPPAKRAPRKRKAPSEKRGRKTTRATKRRKKSESEEVDEGSSEEDFESDLEKVPPQTEDEEMSEGERSGGDEKEQELGRGARGRANARRKARKGGR